MKSYYKISGSSIYRFKIPVISSSMYVLHIGTKCLVIDPFVSEEAAKILHENNIAECLVLLTHEHLDHISGVNWMRSICSCKVICTKACGERISDSRKNGAAYFEALFINHNQQEQEIMKDMLDWNYVCTADDTYMGEMKIEWHGLVIKLKETPGHSPGSQIICVNDKFFFTGDSLIPGQEVITRLPGGSKKEYREKTLPYLRTMPRDSVIFPGHGAEIPYMDFGGEM